MEDNTPQNSFKQKFSGIPKFYPITMLTMVAIVGMVFLTRNAVLDIRQQAASAATIVVDPSVQQGTIQTQLSTNDVWAGILSAIPNGQTKFNSLHAPLVRLHIGDDGGPDAEPQPEIVQNQWDFTNLNVLVNEVFATGQQPLLNMKFAPDWQWTCYPNTQKGATGSVKDTTFQAYAQYMARIVSYYNKGSMTTETGQVITNPAGISHRITWWEPWNEPDLNNETPCAPSSGNGLTPAQYVTMWNAVVPAMLAVDSTLKFVGPATAGSQFGSTTGGTNNTYVDQLMANSTHKPDAISFHGYGYWDNTVSDKWIFDGDNTEPTAHCCGGITDLYYGVQAMHNKYPNTPIWLTEVNVNADWGDDTHKRPWSELGAAWWADAFRQLAPLNAGIIHQYLLAESPQFGLLDTNTGNPYMTYYTMQILNQAFPQGATLLSSTSVQSGVTTLAAKKPDGTISVLVVNRQVGTGASNCGSGGLSATVTVAIQGLTPTSITKQQLDKTNVNCSTNAAIAPITSTLDPNQPITLVFPGYGMAVLTIGTNGQVIPTATPSPIGTTPIPTVAPTSVPGTTATPTPITTSGIYKISGTVFVDTNGNGTKDTGEGGYSLGAKLTLSGTASQTVTSASNGVYTFSNLNNGTYSVSLIVPTGFKATNANPKSKTINGANATANFGIQAITTPTPTPITTIATPTPTTIPTATPTGTQTTSGSIMNLYVNGVVSPWIDNTFSYSARNACDSAMYVSSPCSYAVTLKAYGAIELIDKTSLDPTLYKSFDYNINTQGQPISNFGVTISTSGGGWINEIRLSSANVTASLPNGWVHVSIPMSTLNPSNKIFGSFDLENALNSAVGQIHIDDVQLIGK